MRPLTQLDAEEVSEVSEVSALRVPRNATLTDAGKALTKRVTDADSARAFFAGVSNVFELHPLSYLLPVMEYAVDLHSKYMFPFERACSEAFLAVPERNIAAAAERYLRLVDSGRASGTPTSGGDVATFFKRRKLRKVNAANYGVHFHKVLVKFATAVGANRSLDILEARPQRGGARGLSELLGDLATARDIDNIVAEVIGPYYAGSRGADRVTYSDMKVMQRLVFRRLTKILKGNELMGEFNPAIVANARRITDMFYATMCFAVVAVHRADLARAPPEAQRFVRMYRHTNAYVTHSAYSSIIKLQYSFVDSVPVAMLTATEPDVVQSFTIMGSNLCKHVNGTSITSRIQTVLNVIRDSTTAVTTAILIGSIVTATQGGALVPVLAAVGVSNPALAANIAFRISKSHSLLVQAIRGILAIHKYRVEKRDASGYSVQTGRARARSARKGL